jgi:penicillin amidase
LPRVRAPLILTAFALAAPAILAGPAGEAAGERSGPVTIPGLHAPVRLVTDHFGVPHLRAQNLGDLYRAWGYVTARDRLWQLEYSRRAGRGELWRWFGNATLRGDGGAQLFRFRERAAAIWARDRARPAVAFALERYAAGINAFIARCRSGERHGRRSSRCSHHQPEDWKPRTACCSAGARRDARPRSAELEEGRDVASHGERVDRARGAASRTGGSTTPSRTAQRAGGARRARPPAHAAA